MCDLDGDLAAVWNEYPRRAAKPHSCSACFVTISKGEYYLVHSDLYEGAWNSEKMCFYCWAARERFAQDGGHMYCPPSALRETLRECISDNGNYKDDEWRPVLAGILKRLRVSPTRRRHQQEKRTRRNAAQ